MTNNQLRYHQLQEDKRKNRAVETETNRSNLAKELELNRSNTVNEKLKQAGLDIQEAKFINDAIQGVLSTIIGGLKIL